MQARHLKISPLQPQEFPLTWEVLSRGIGENVAPGMVAGLWSAHDPGKVRVAAIGSRRLPSAASPVLPMEPLTIFDLASVTKVYATATLCALLVERRWISWETPVRSILPDFKNGDVRIRHLLSHTSGLPAWAPLFEKMRERFGSTGKPIYRFPVSERQSAMRELVFGVPLERRVGEQPVYSDIGFMLLGFALEEIVQLPLDRAVETLLWKPMGQSASFFHRVTASPAAATLPQVAATEDCPWRGGVLQGQVHDDNCWTMGGYSGHAGAFGDARDVLFFAKRLLGGFLSRETLSAAWTRVERPLGCERTLGWDTPSGSQPAAGRFFSERTIGHLGFTGTSLWIDPEAELAAVLLTNRVHPSRDNSKIRNFRPLFHEALRQDFLKTVLGR